MVTAYWKIGKSIFEACGENGRAAYGKQMLKYISERMTEEFGKGFDIRNLRYMRQFYLVCPNVNALRSELSWTHYRLLDERYDAQTLRRAEQVIREQMRKYESLFSSGC